MSTARSRWGAGRGQVQRIYGITHIKMHMMGDAIDLTIGGDFFPIFFSLNSVDTLGVLAGGLRAGV